jgi:ABC-type antimicrobial peptide transport system permease subunit
VASAAERLQSFNEVENTYLDVFTLLGGLGVILGVAGLGILLLRNVRDRKGEIATCLAIGFRRGRSSGS